MMRDYRMRFRPHIFSRAVANSEGRWPTNSNHITLMCPLIIVMTLAGCSTSAPMEASTAEQAFRNIEHSVKNAKTLRAKFAIDRSGRSFPEMGGTLLLKHGPKVNFYWKQKNAEEAPFKESRFVWD